MNDCTIDYDVMSGCYRDMAYCECCGKEITADEACDYDNLCEECAQF